MSSHVLSKDAGLLLQAAHFASCKHRNHKRKNLGKDPYINHPLEVAELLTRIAKEQDVDVVIAAILHDTIEDTQTTAAEIKAKFGQRVASLVLEVTDDKNLPKMERKQQQIQNATYKSSAAKKIALADKISNIARMASDPPINWSLARKIEYLHWAKQVVAGLKGCNEDLECLFEQTYQQNLTVLENQQKKLQGQER